MLVHLWGFPGKNTRVGFHFLLPGIFPIRGSNPGLLHCRQILYHLSYNESPHPALEPFQCTMSSVYTTLYVVVVEKEMATHSSILA